MNFDKDYLVELLDANDFDTTDDNIELLDEQLSNGEAIVLDATQDMFESDNEDYTLMQVLDENGFLVSEHNLAVLKEAIENGHVLLEDKQSAKRKWKNVAKVAAGTLAGAAIGAAAGTAIGTKVGKNIGDGKVAESNKKVEDAAAKADEIEATEKEANKTAADATKAAAKDEKSLDDYAKADDTKAAADKASEEKAAASKNEAKSDQKKELGLQGTDSDDAVKMAQDKLVKDKQVNGAIIGGSTGIAAGGAIGGTGAWHLRKHSKGYIEDGGKDPEESKKDKPKKQNGSIKE